MRIMKNYLKVGIRVYRDENGVQQTEEYTYEKDDALIAEEQAQATKQNRMQEIRTRLQELDIKRFKYIDKHITEAEYEPFRTEANALRDEYNALEV